MSRGVPAKEFRVLVSSNLLLAVSESSTAYAQCISLLQRNSTKDVAPPTLTVPCCSSYLVIAVQPLFYSLLSSLLEVVPQAAASEQPHLHDAKCKY